MRKKRVRHHVNPLAFRGEPEIPDWSKVFAHPQQDLEVDVGCAGGRFMLTRAASEPTINIVGLEIRKPVVAIVAERIAQRKLTNAHVVCCNANQSLRSLFPDDSISRLYVHFPDPWFKKRHHKRRLIKAEFLVDLAAVLKLGGEFHFATDYKDYAEEVLALLNIDPDFSAPKAVPPPFGIETEREEVHGAKGDTIHRYCFILEQRIAKPEQLVLPED